MKIKYDAKADAAYIQLAADIGAGGVAKTYLCDQSEIGAMINLDFDSDGRLVGIEILDASKTLPSRLLNSTDSKR
jgi:uncharacterized protein YuzE